MILENITGEVKVTIGNKAIAVGDTVEDAEYASVVVAGKGKAVFRVDPNTTIERYGVKSEAVAAPKPAPVKVAPVEAAPVAERVTETVETPGKTAEA
jgi:hypothetical protein